MLLAYGEGFNQALLRGFRGAYDDGVTVMFPGQTSMQAGGERAGRRVRLRLADAEAIGELPFVRAWSPEFIQNVTVARGAKQAGYSARGVAPAYATIRRPRGASSTPRTCGSRGASCSSAARSR
jgi:putative ABC transport system permease protein